MGEPPKDIITYRTKELAVPFPLIQDLFKEGEKVSGGADNGSENDYFDEEGKATKPKLPERFTPLTLGDDPSKYYFVFYTDRTGSYFTEDTRGMSACIATQPRKTASNDRLREIIYSSEKNGFYATVSENINNRAFLEWQNANEQELVKPSGRMKARYRLIDANQREVVEFTADRVDEVIFSGGEAQPGRWTRRLKIDNQQKNTEYHDLYILNRSKDPERETRADVSFRIDGTLDNPKSIVVAIGYGPSTRMRTILEDPERNIRVVVYKGFEKQLEVLNQDPNYAFLKKDTLDTDKILTLIRERVSSLREHWDQPQSVFDINPQLETSKPPELR